MKTHRLIALFLSVSAVGCMAEVATTTAPPAPITEDEGCSETLCLDDDAQVSLADAKQDLATCVPNDHTSDGDPSGLRISEVTSLGGADGVHTIRVVLANTLPDGVMTYPGTRLRVVAGDGSVPAENAGQLYGIFGCDETETIYDVAWDGQAPLTLVAEATNDLGRTVIHDVEVTLQPTE